MTSQQCYPVQIPPQALPPSVPGLYKYRFFDTRLTWYGWNFTQPPNPTFEFCFLVATLYFRLSRCKSFSRTLEVSIFRSVLYSQSTGSNTKNHFTTPGNISIWRFCLKIVNPALAFMRGCHLNSLQDGGLELATQVRTLRERQSPPLLESPVPLPFTGEVRSFLARGILARIFN